MFFISVKFISAIINNNNNLKVTHKVANYSALEDQYIFQSIAVKSLSPINCEAHKFLTNTGWKILISYSWR